jgi:hypothetical protein
MTTQKQKRNNMAEENKKEEVEQKSTLGERMSDMAGIRVLRDGKWESVVPKPNPESKPTSK